jgi:hypothetical protein
MTVSESIFQQLSREVAEAQRHILHDLSPHRATRRYTSSQRANSTPGASMSLSDIANKLETDIADGIAKVRAVATAVDNDPVVQSALNIADSVAPEVRQAAADILPLLTGVHPGAIADLMMLLKGAIGMAAKAAV